MSVEITYLGHSGLLLSADGMSVCIDPFLTGNPLAKHKVEDIRCDYVAITHGHEDHFGEDTLQILRRNAATLVAAYEITNYAQSQGIEKVEPGNPGGCIKFPFGFIAFTQAFHSSSYKTQYMGQPCGLVVSIGGKVIYHAGDTALFSDMQLIGELYEPDVSVLPVGDRFTMGPEMAAAAAEMIGAPYTIPVHYKTFPLLLSDISAFEPENIEVKVLEPGESFIL
jgi:L-ascorbate metabolism protein UlaG (beta-lactamase superfamily)